jgi:hypothetical protein
LYFKGAIVNTLSRRSVALFIAIALILTFSSAISIQAADETVYKQLDCNTLYTIIINAGYKVYPNSNSDDEIVPCGEQDEIIVGLKDDVAVVKLVNNNKTVEFYTFLKIKNQNILNIINDWNRNNYYSRSYVDQGGDPTLELELDLTGGVTEARILDFFKTCENHFSRWRKEISR